MIKVLLVDDEKLILNTLHKNISWSQYNMQVVGEATNGLTALEFLKNNLVDLVVTDIKMPHMDGIELIKKIKSINSEIIIIIISAYSEFNLVKQGFKYGALDYILKVDLDDKSIVDPILSKVQTLLLPPTEILKLNMYIKQLHHPYKLHQTQPYSCTYYLKTHDVLFKTSLITLIDGLSLPYTTYDDYVVITLIAIDQIYLRAAQRHWLDCFHTLIASMKSIPYSFYVGPIILLDQIKDALIEHQKKCDLLFFYEEKKLTSTSLKICYDPHAVPSFISKKNDLLTCIKQFSIKDLLLRWNEFLSCMKLLYILPQTFLEEAHNVLSFLINILELYGFNISSLNDPQNNNLNLIMGFETFSEFNQWSNTLLLEATSIINLQKEQQLHTLFLNYIHTNYDNPDLSLDLLSTHLSLPKYQLRKICMQVTNMHFKAYLNYVRIENAKLLLLNTDLRVNKICYKIGYSNVEHFSRSFSKLVGMSPLAFQEYNLNKCSS